MRRERFNSAGNSTHIIYVTDNVSDFMLDLCYGLNCILKLNPNPGLFPKKVFEWRSKSCIQSGSIHFFRFLDKPWAYTGRTYFWTFFMPSKLQNSAFLIQTNMSSQDWNLHFMTEICRPEELRTGPFSIRQIYFCVKIWLVEDKTWIASSGLHTKELIRQPNDQPLKNWFIRTFFCRRTNLFYNP